MEERLSHHQKINIVSRGLQRNPFFHPIRLHILQLVISTNMDQTQITMKEKTLELPPVEGFHFTLLPNQTMGYNKIHPYRWTNLLNSISRGTHHVDSIPITGFQYTYDRNH